MNSTAKKILDDARKALRDDPLAVWPTTAIEFVEMLRDREKELVAMHQQMGKMASREAKAVG